MSTTITWTIKCLTGASAGTEQTLAQWGLSQAKIKMVPTGQDVATFKAVVPAADAAVPFAFRDMAAIYQNSTDSGTGITTKTRWFVGFWTKTPRTIASNDESIDYELSGSPWYFLNNIVFQQSWTSLNAASPTIPATVTKPFGVIGLAVDGTQSDLAAVLLTVLDYAIAAGAAQTTPIVPFTIGTVSMNDMIIPYEQVANVTCAQTIIHCLRWSPDVAFTVDYSEPTAGAPPTITIVPRSTLGAVALSVNGPPVSNISKITARPDLQVPGVIIYYDTTNTIDGTPYAYQVIDKYPSGMNPQEIGTLAPYVDLEGGSETFEKCVIGTTTAPKAATDSVALPWVKNQVPDLWAQSNGVTYDYDVANIGIAAITTTIDPNDPAATDPPTGWPGADNLPEELITGEIKPWMLLQDGSESSGYYAAKVKKTVTLKYTGTDLKTLMLFSGNPALPATWTFTVNCKVTSASSGTFSRLTSFQQSESPPENLAQLLYEARQMLHFEGSVETTEGECSGIVKLSNVLNLSGALSDWSTMNAMITGIDCDIDNGKTTIRIGPPNNLGISDYMDLLRCFRIRQPTWRLQEKTTGDGATDNVNGHTHAHHTSHVMLPVVHAPGPFQCFLQKTASGAYKIMVSPNSYLMKSLKPTDSFPITGLGTFMSSSTSDYGWLETEFDNTGNILSSTIKSIATGGTWSLSSDPGSGGYVDYTTSTDGSGNILYNVTTVRVLLWQCIADPVTGAVPLLFQKQKNNLMVFWQVIDVGYAAPTIVPITSGGAS